MKMKDTHDSWDAGFRAGFLMGFTASGEGWNGEYPFDKDPYAVAKSKAVQDSLDRAINTMGPTPPSITDITRSDT